MNLIRNLPDNMIYPKTKRSIEKAISVIGYNSNRGAIDKINMQTSFVECVRKSVKWYKK